MKTENSEIIYIYLIHYFCKEAKSFLSRINVSHKLCNWSNKNVFLEIIFKMETYNYLQSICRGAHFLASLLVLLITELFGVS